MTLQRKSESYGWILEVLLNLATVVVVRSRFLLFDPLYCLSSLRYSMYVCQESRSRPIGDVGRGAEEKWIKCILRYCIALMQVKYSSEGDASFFSKNSRWLWRQFRRFLYHIFTSEEFFVVENADLPRCCAHRRWISFHWSDVRRILSESAWIIDFFFVICVSCLRVKVLSSENRGNKFWYQFFIVNENWNRIIA